MIEYWWNSIHWKKQWFWLWVAYLIFTIGHLFEYGEAGSDAVATLLVTIVFWTMIKETDKQKERDELLNMFRSYSKQMERIGFAFGGYKEYHDWMRQHYYTDEDGILHERRGTFAVERALHRNGGRGAEHGEHGVSGSEEDPRDPPDESLCLR